MRKEAIAIQRVLDAHKVGAQVLGPPDSFQSSALNVYRLNRESGITVDKVAKLAPEIDEILTSQRRAETYCRVASTPLRVEVPRQDKQIVSIYDVLPEVRRQLNGPQPNRLLLVAGESVQFDRATPYLFDLLNPNTPHLFVAGTTGSGKSNELLSMIVSLANLNDARRLSIVVLDPKGIDLHCLNGLPHLAGPVVRDALDCVPVLKSVVEEMDRRKKSGKAPTHQIVVAIDEVADLMDVAGDEVAYYIKRIMQLGRGLGIYVIAATQKPSAEQVGSIIKANFPVKLVGAVASTNDANVAAGTGGTRAEKLPGKGSFLVVKGSSVKSLQAYYADKDETTQRCGMAGKQNATYQPVWQYSTGATKQERPVTPERVYQTTVPAYVPDDGPQTDQPTSTDFLPFGPLDRYGQSIIKTLYRQHGSKNAVIRAVWPNHRKQTCLEYINPVIERMAE